MKFLRSSVISWVLAVLSFVQFLPINQVWFWKLSLVTTESSHILAVFALVSMYFANSRHTRLTLGLATILFLLPLMQLFAHMQFWRFQLETFIGEPKISARYSQLFLGPFANSNKHEEIAFTTDLKFDFYRAKGTTAPSPLLVVIPGGSWASSDTKMLWELNAHLADRGYAVAVIPYRVAPQHQWPSQRDDIESAIAHLRAHASELNIDMNRWVVLGRSAGGQLAESIAFAGKQSGLRGGIYLYAPSDMNFAYRISREDDIIQSPQLMRNFLGGSPSERKLAFAEASPLDYVSPTSPPALIIHGSRDPLVWSVHSQRLFAKLIENKVPAAYIEIPWATHGFDYIFMGPGSVAGTYAIENFLAKCFANL